MKSWLKVAVLSGWLLCLSVQGAEPNTYKVNLKDADIKAFIEQVAGITGKTFVVENRVKGKVTVISSTPMSEEEVYQLFLAVLNVNNYAALPSGDVIKIINQNEVKQEGSDLGQSLEKKGEEIVTRVVQIKNTAATELVPILRPLVAKFGHLAGVASANALIISDRAANIERIVDIIERLDSAGSAEIEVVELQHAWVGDVVDLLESLAPEQVESAGKGAAARRKKSAGNDLIRVVADERGNRLIIRGEKTSRERIKDLIAKLDQPAAYQGAAQVIRLKHADAKALEEVLKGLTQQATGGGGANRKATANPNSDTYIFADESLNALVIRAEPAVVAELLDVIAQLDVRRAQVLIEAAIVEVRGDLSGQFSFQFAAGNTEEPAGGTNFSNAGISTSQILSAAQAGTPPAIPSGIVLGAVNEVGGEARFGFLIQALASASNANLLSTPSIMTLDNQEAEIVVGQNVPFVTGQTAGDNNSNPFTTISREDVGITLKVVPHLHDGKVVRLEVEVTSDQVTETVVSGSADLVTDKREIKTVILADDQETIVLGGLIQDNLTESEAKVPWLGDLPLIGWLFKSVSKTKVKSNLLVFLRPTIMRDREDAAQLTDRSYKGIWEINLGKLKGDDDDEEYREHNIDDLFNGKYHDPDLAEPAEN